MTIEAPDFQSYTVTTAPVARADDQSHVDCALTDLEKAQAELAHVVDVLGIRLRPVSAITDSPENGMAMAADPSERSPLVRSIREAVARTRRQTRQVLEITEGLDV